MSKYIIELDYDLQRVVGVGVKEGTVWVKDYDVDDLEEYIPVDVEDVYDKAYSDGYNKGLKYGKAVNDKGCEGCMYQDTTIEHNPCNLCCNAFLNKWTAKQTDGKIEVGDEVKLCSHKEPYLVTSYEQDNNMCILMSVRGGFFRAEKCDIRKTGRHFDIDKILDEMKGTGTDDDTY